MRWCEDRWQATEQLKLLNDLTTWKLLLTSNWSKSHSINVGNRIGNIAELTKLITTENQQRSSTFTNAETLSWLRQGFRPRCRQRANFRVVIEGWVRMCSGVQHAGRTGRPPSWARPCVVVGPGSRCGSSCRFLNLVRLTVWRRIPIWRAQP